MKNIIQKLERFGISTISHTHSTLLSHLEGTYEI
jgi:hypothetical protein